MKRVAIIQARGDGERWPGKHTAIIGGKPLVAWPIEHAQQSRFDLVVLSTNDEKIAEIGRQRGVAIQWRDRLLTDDAALLAKAPGREGIYGLLYSCYAKAAAEHGVPEPF